MLLNNIRLNQLEFQRLLQQLTVSKDLNGLGLKYENNKTLDITCESITERVIINDIDNIKKYWLMDNLLLSNIKYSVLQKDLIDNLDLNDYSIRFSLCNESELESVSEEIEYENKLFRYKNRYSIFTEDNMFRFDLSEVKTSEGNTIKESKLFKKINEYEIEIEYIGDSKDKDYIFDKLIYNVGVLISLYQDSYYIVSQNTYDSIKTLYISITGTEKFIAANPITLQLKNLVKSKKYINIFNNYAVTYKADGERNFLIVNDNLFLINNNFHIRSLGISNDNQGVFTQNINNLSNDFCINLLDMNVKWSKYDDFNYVGADKISEKEIKTASSVDLSLGSNSQLRAIVEVYASDDNKDKFINDFISAWNKVMNNDRFDV